MGVEKQVNGVGIGLGHQRYVLIWFGLAHGWRAAFERVVSLDLGAAGCVPGWRWERTGHGML